MILVLLAGCGAGLGVMSSRAGAASAPVSLSLSSMGVMENGVAGTLVATLATEDPDAGDTHLFSLVDGAGATDNNGFLITGNRLTVRYGVMRADGKYVDFEAESLVFGIRIRVTDSTGLTFEKAFQLPLMDDRNEDADHDGLTEAAEEDIHGSSDVLFDTDRDGFGDGYEVQGGSSPVDPTSWPAFPVIGWGGNSAGELRAPDDASFYKLSTGQQHTLGLRPDGTLSAWAGLNRYGQITIPVGLTDVVAIAAGGDFWSDDSAHSLALRRNGTVVAWGCNDDRQTNVPAGLGGVIRIASGRAHSLALKSDGTVVAWGCNTSGQCHVPENLSGVIGIAAGGFYSMALKSDGTVVCWGDNFNGVLWENAAAPAGLCDVVSISGGRFHMLALRKDGTVVGWGYNLDGQAQVPAGLEGVTAVAAGGFHSLALKSDGAVVAWGGNGSGQAAIPPSAHSHVKAISAGLLHSIAIRKVTGHPEISSSAMVSCSPGDPVAHQITVANAIPTEYSAMGLPEGLSLDPQTGLLSGTVGNFCRSSVHIIAETDRGRLTQALWINAFTGAAPSSITVSPAVVMENAALDSIVGTLAATDPDAGDVHTFELVDGAGAQDNGLFAITGDQLRVGKKSGRDYETNPAGFSIRVRARDGSLNYQEQVIAVSFADDRMEDADNDGLTEADEEDIHGTSDTKLDTDGDGFGDGFEVSHGSSPSSGTNVPQGRMLVSWGSGEKGQTSPPAGADGSLAVAGGWGHTLALSSSGTVTAWGWNGEGQCAVPEGLADVVEVGAGDFHSVVLCKDGRVTAWGGNEFGQTTVPPELAGVIAISAGSYHNLALKSDGTVVAWGDNENGQCVVPAGLSDVIAIAAGGHHSLALKGDGTVVGWGASWSGAAAVPAGLEKIVAIAAGGFHSLALNSDGVVAAWGAGEMGQTYVPAGLTGVVEVKAGWLHSLALKKDGTLVSWGANLKGQSMPPLEAKHVQAIAAGDFHNVAIRQASGFPRLETGDPLKGWPGVHLSRPLVVSGALPLHFTSTPLPDGLSLDPATGVISGTVGTGARRAVKIRVETDKGVLSRVFWMNTADGRPPVSISLQGATGGAPSLMENSPAGTVAGILTVADPDPGDSHSFEIFITGGFAPSYGLIASGNQLMVAPGAAIDYEAVPPPALVLRVRAIDSAFNVLEQNVTLLLLDDRTEDADRDGITEAEEEDVFFTSDLVFTRLSTLDADGDGIPALVEHAFNMNLRVADGGLRLGGPGSTSGLPLITTVMDTGGQPRLRMEYIRRVGSTLSYVPQFSGDIGSPAGWTAATAPVQVVPVNAEWDRCTVEDAVVIPAASRRFGRVKITR